MWNKFSACASNLVSSSQTFSSPQRDQRQEGLQIFLLSTDEEIPQVWVWFSGTVVQYIVVYSILLYLDK